MSGDDRDKKKDVSKAETPPAAKPRSSLRPNALNSADNTTDAIARYAKLLEQQQPDFNLLTRYEKLFGGATQVNAGYNALSRAFKDAGLQTERINELWANKSLRDYQYPQPLNELYKVLADSDSAKARNALKHNAPAYALRDLEASYFVNAEIANLQKTLAEQTKRVESAASQSAKIQELQATVTNLEKLQETQKLAFLLERVHPDARQHLESNKDLRDKFLSGKTDDVFVMSVDIRRSTELMLKARSPEAFAEFITKLCHALMNVIREDFGVVDKFTGDGVLAFFPSFYSGEDAGYWALRAAARCHAVFADLYGKSRHLFNSVLLDVGLGIGVDFGRATIVQVAGGLTVVGEPVVYACRLSGGEANTTLLNQPAFEVIAKRYPKAYAVVETPLPIKNEGRFLTYAVGLVDDTIKVHHPSWERPDGAKA